MSLQKRYIISLEVSGPDGFLRSCKWAVRPTGSSNTAAVGFWMRLLGNFTRYLITVGHAEVVSSRVGRPRGLIN